MAQPWSVDPLSPTRRTRRTEPDILKMARMFQPRAVKSSMMRVMMKMMKKCSAASGILKTEICTKHINERTPDGHFDSNNIFNI